MINIEIQSLSECSALFCVPPNVLGQTLGIGVGTHFILGGRGGRVGLKGCWMTHPTKLCKRRRLLLDKMPILVYFGRMQKQGLNLSLPLL